MMQDMQYKDVRKDVCHKNKNRKTLKTLNKKLFVKILTPVEKLLTKQYLTWQMVNVELKLLFAFVV